MNHIIDGVSSNLSVLYCIVENLVTYSFVFTLSNLSIYRLYSVASNINSDSDLVYDFYDWAWQILQHFDDSNLGLFFVNCLGFTILLLLWKGALGILRMQSREQTTSSQFLHIL